MNLRDWNEFLWQVIDTRLYKPGSLLYLAFDESLLEEEFKKAGIDLPEGGPTKGLNKTIQLHCRTMTNGSVRLSREPDGRGWSGNWHWVFETDEMGLTLALTFAVQQILAAEHMQGVSFYTAYWGMLGATAEETRINPFGDQGKNSFAILWARLRVELKDTLGVEDTEITFAPGRGSNKYRNFPVSQSLLSEGDMRLSSSAIRGATRMSDERLYAALRRVGLSSSGCRKVYIASLRDNLIVQFREFLESESSNGIAVAKPRLRKLTAKIDLSALLLYEDYELFGDSVFHCVSTNDAIQATEALDSYLSENRCLVFEEEDGRISASPNQTLGEAEIQVFILARPSQIEEMLVAAPSDGSIPPLHEHFAPANISLAGDFALIRCLSLPDALENVDISTEVHRRLASKASDEVKIEFRGGLCVNKSSNAYIVGFGPESIVCDGDSVERDSECELDAEVMSVAEALERLSKANKSCRYMIRISDKTIFINMFEGKIPDLRPGYVLTDFCLLPVGLTNSSESEAAHDINFVCDVDTVAWGIHREELVRTLESQMAKRDARWIKAASPSIEECLAAISYLNLPSSFASIVIRKIKSTSLVPWPLFRRLTTR